MRTEMVIRIRGSGGGAEKAHAKAMKVAAAIDGVESVTVAGKDKSLLRVVGDGVDCNHLTTRLRRKVGHADVVELRTLGAGGTTAARGPGGGYYYGGTHGAGGYYGASGAYSGGYPSSSASTSGGGYAAAPEYYSSQQPAYEPYYRGPAAYGAPTVVHHEYYPAAGATDPAGCSIM